MEERQYIGILTDNLEAGGKERIYLNRSNAIQYMVKSLLLPMGSDTFFTGYIDSFEENEITDDEYLSDEERMAAFDRAVYNRLFIFFRKSGQENSAMNGMFPKLARANLVDCPQEFDKDTLFHSVPVFASAEDGLVRDWECERRWYHSYRKYKSLDEFIAYITEQKSVGAIYGYASSEFSPSFVIWKEPQGKLFAIGKIESIRLDSLGCMILKGENLFKINLSDYEEFLVYDPAVNPTMMFIPENIHKKIEDEITKNAICIHPTAGSNSDTEALADVGGAPEAGDEVVEISEPNPVRLIEIDTSKKDDALIIQTMNYHSNRRELYYHINDFINFHTAVKCSNLVILSGLSGTGKSALVDIYARALGIHSSTNPEEERLLFIPVRPSWNDDADLLGYVDLVHMVYRASDTGFVDFLVRAQREENKKKIFMVCFDEMNLARIEHYFSQFLSILERPVAQRKLQLYNDQYSGRLYNASAYPSSITIGDNIRFIGTVNIDESTYHFSDKVLDRANVIQLDVLDYSKDWVRQNYGTLGNIVWTIDDYKNLIRGNDASMSKVHQLLWEIHTLMQSASSKYGVGPRVVKAITLYLNNLPTDRYKEFDIAKGLDYQISQRVLTKVRGPESQIGDILNEQSGQNFLKIFDKYKELSQFEKCRAIVRQKQKEIKSYGYCT